MRLHYLPPVDDESWTELNVFVKRWFMNVYGDDLTKLVIIIPRANIDESAIMAEEAHWREIYLAARQINLSLPGEQLQAWRVIYHYGDEIAPGLRVFRLRESKSPCWFWISPDPGLIETQTRLADLIPKIAAYWHIKQGRGLFHAAGIIRKNSAFIFSGVSGAGKSTVASLSRLRSFQVIHDDHVIAHETSKADWRISDVTHSTHNIPLKAILFLVQDTRDQLIPLQSTTTAMRLLGSLREHGRYVLFGDTLKTAFSTTAEIARWVPGYELHFRKSPDFWQLIDEQFPD